MAHTTTAPATQAEWLDQQARLAWQYTHPQLRRYLAAYDTTAHGRYLAYCRQNGRQP
jgi:hypothetical protein